MAHRLDDVAGAGLTLRADHRCALADAPQRLAEVRRAAHERHRELPLVDVMGLVGPDHVPAHAALQPLAQASLDPERAGLGRAHRLESTGQPGMLPPPIGGSSTHVLPGVSLIGAPAASVYVVTASVAVLFHVPF